MNETTTKLTERQRARRRIARTIGRAIWQGELKEDNPDITPEEINAAWKDASNMVTKAGMRALIALERAGYDVKDKPAQD